MMGPSPSMSSAVSDALTGFRRQQARLGAAAEKLAAGSGDFARNVIEMKSAETAAKVSVAVARTSLDMQASAIDLLA